MKKTSEGSTQGETDSENSENSAPLETKKIVLQLRLKREEKEVRAMIIIILAVAFIVGLVAACSWARNVKEFHAIVYQG